MRETFGAVTGLLGRTLDGLTLQQKAIASNLANANTPGYKPFGVILTEELRGERLPLHRSHSKHIMPGPRTAARLVRLNEAMRNDGNGVDVERELVSLAEAQLRYSLVTETLNRRYQRLGLVLRGRA